MKTITTTTREEFKDAMNGEKTCDYDVLVKNDMQTLMCIAHNGSVVIECELWSIMDMLLED